MAGKRIPPPLPRMGSIFDLRSSIFDLWLMVIWFSANISAAGNWQRSNGHCRISLNCWWHSLSSFGQIREREGEKERGRAREHRTGRCCSRHGTRPFGGTYVHTTARKAVISGSALLSINKSLLARKENGQAGTRQIPGRGRACVTFRGTKIRARVTRGYCNYVERTQAKEAIVIYYDRHGTQRDISYTIYTIYMHVNFVSKSTLCWANSLRKVPPNGA